MSALTERDRRIRQRLKDDFVAYAGRCLKIRTKLGGLAPLVLNRAQRHLHQCLEEQRARTGRVRAFVLKGRQQGVSTYVGARFFHRTTHERGVRTFILTHEMEATRNLLEMAQRFHRHCPAPLRPRLGLNNAREMHFPLLDSGYRVGTAGARGVGRSLTVQLFHASEVAFWPRAQEHAAGVLQAIADAEGTEVILESTASGMGNFFHAGWQAAEAGQGPYQAVFLPWFWQPEYSAAPGPDFTPDDEEREYMALHGLVPGQLAWRRAKIAELKDALLFRQEYPATPAEAFQNTGQTPFIDPLLVLRARRADEAGHGPVVAGVDPARFGDDATAAIFRQGRKAFGLRTWRGRDTMQVAGICRRMLEAESPRLERLFVDVGGLGAGVVDRLREMGFERRLTAVNFGARALRPERYRNKRAEMWAGLRDWLADETQADLPDDDALHADLTGPSYSWDSASRLVLEPKEDMRARGLRSPDLADALALTFAAPVRGAAPAQRYADGATPSFGHRPRAGAPEA